jgi:hypothetical protein
MSTFKLHTLKQKLWAIVAASFVARAIVFFALPDKASVSLAPDENGYAVIARDISSLSITESLSKFFDNSVLGRTLVIPSSFLMRTGFSDIESVRITSMLYGQFSLVVLVLFVIKYGNFVSYTSRQQNLLALVIFLFAIWPSRFLWSSLGLRESSLEFFLIVVFLSLYTIFSENFTKNWLSSAFLFCGITLIFMTRVQLGWLTVVWITLWLMFKLRDWKNVYLVPLVLTGMMSGYLLTIPVTVIRSDSYIAKEIDGKAIDSASVAKASKMCDGTKKIIVDGERRFECVKSGQTRKLEGIRNPGSAALEEINLIPFKQEVNQVDAASAIKTIFCPFTGEGSVQKYSCLAWRAPYASTTFLFRPLPFLDTTSKVSYFAAIENLFWLFAVVLIVYRALMRRKLALPRELIPPLVFLVIYVVGAGSYEGNMGTAFRHKSLILSIVLLFIAEAFWRNSQQEPGEAGINRQKARFN